MPIDARIALAGNPLQIDNPLDVYTKGMNIAGQQKQNRLADLAYGQKQGEVDSANALKKAYAAAVKPDGTLDRDALRSNLAAAGQGQAIPEVNAAFSGEDKAALEAKDAGLKRALGVMTFVAQNLSGATAENYDAMRQSIAESAGPEVAAKLPQAFDPAAIQAMIQSSIPVIDQHKAEAAKTAAALAQANQEANRATVRRGQDMSSADRRAAIQAQRDDAVAKSAGSDKPMPAPALKMQDERLEAIGTGAQVIADVKALTKQIDDGVLTFGAVSNTANKLRNLTGATSTDESRAFASAVSSFEKLRNDTLQLAKGVQTDGDAQRAFKALFAGINDPKVVKDQLLKIKDFNEQSTKLHKNRLNAIRQNYGNGPMDTSAFEQSSTGIGLGLAEDKGPSDAQFLGFEGE